MSLTSSSRCSDLSPSSPRPSHQRDKHANVDEHPKEDRNEERLGHSAAAASPRSYSSSFVSSIGSPSDHTSETHPDPTSSPCSAPEPSSALLPAALLESIIQSISLLWQLRIAGTGNFHLLANQNNNTLARTDPFRIELSLGHGAYGLLSRLLRLGAFTGVPDPDCERRRYKGGKSWDQPTDALLHSAADAVVGGLQERNTNNPSSVSEGEASSLTFLGGLGRWVLETLRLEYDYDDGILSIRMNSVFHDDASYDVAQELLSCIQQAVGGQTRRFAAKSMPFDADAGVLEPDQTQPEQPEPEEDEGIALSSVTAAPKRNKYQPDYGIYDEIRGKSLYPGLILEFGWAHPTHCKRAKKYIYAGKGQVRSVLLLNVDYQQPKERFQKLISSASAPKPATEPAPKPAPIHLTGYRFDADESSWGPKKFINTWDLREAASHDSQLTLSGDWVSEHLVADLQIRIPVRVIVENIDRSLRLQERADRQELGLPTGIPPSTSILGKRQRTESPDSESGAEYQQPTGGDHGSGSSPRMLRSRTVPEISGPERPRAPLKRRKG